MKRNSVNGRRRKIIPLCYQGKNLSKSNTSLSQLLSIGSYKKCINALKRNNRDLAVALQDARCEAAYQSNLLKDYSRDTNQIMFARLKLKEMAKTITKLVTDLDEVASCLEVDLPSDKCNLLQKNRSSRDRMKIQAPTVDCIEEVSVLSSEIEECPEGNGSQLATTSNEIPSRKSLDKAENAYEIQPSTSECDTDLDMPPVLFVEDSNEKDMERHLSQRSKSSKIHTSDQASLTPELDIDFSCFSRKRSSGRGQSQFIPLAPSSTRSRKSRRTSVLNLASIEDATPKRNPSCSETIAHRKLHSVLVDYEQDSEENKTAEAAFVNAKERGSKNASSSPQDFNYASIHITDHDVVFNCPSDAPLAVVPANATASTIPNIECTQDNQTILSCEDMELTEVINPVKQIISEIPSTAKPQDSSVIQSCVLENEKFDESVEKVCCEDEIPKLTENAKSIAIIHKDKYLSEIENKNDDVCENSETFERVESFNENHSVSPHCTRSSRNRKNIEYKVFFSSSGSESDSTPVKPELNEMKFNRIQRETVIFKPKSGKNTSNTADNCQSAEKTSLKKQHVNKVSLNAFSVYDLDVSNSEKPTKKSRAKSKTKKSHNKETTKPLLQNCNVTKLKGVNYKFTRNEKFITKVQENQLLQNCKSLLDSNPTTSINDTVKQNQQNLPVNNIEEDTDTKTENRNSISSSGDENLISDFKHQNIRIRTPKSETRRVSFATTDLVCNFTKESLSKAIAGNKKIHRASKSVFEFNGLLDQQTSEIKKTLHFEIDKSPDGISEASHNSKEPFNFCEETELYTFILPSNTHKTTDTANVHSVSETLVSSVTVPPIIYDNSDDPNFKENQLTVKNKSGKVSLKRVKRPISGKVDRDAPSESLSSDSPVVEPKHKSSHKMLSHDDVKENIHTNSETLNIAQTKTQIKSKISIKSHLPPVDNFDVQVPVDDIKIVTKSSRKKNNSSQKQKLLQQTPDKTSKKSSRKFVGSSPVLKDVMNFEEGRESMKRRAKVVSYKEPPLNKKLRRA